MAEGDAGWGRPEEGVRRALARYGQLLDDGRFEEWVRLFTDDVVFRVMGQEHVGPEAVRAFVEPTQGEDARGTHLLSEPLIEVLGDGERASAWTDFAFLTRDGRVEATGRYHDELRRDGGGDWRFALREIVLKGLVR